MNRFLFLSSFIFLFTSCSDIDEDIIPLVGIYRTHLVGIAGPFDLIISTDRGDDVIIEAPFDGFDWYTIKADINNQKESTMDINIKSQEIDSFKELKGEGFFRDGTIELRYSINFDGELFHYSMVGTKI